METIKTYKGFNKDMKRVLKEYCKEHDGKFFTVYEEICRVKE